MAGGQLLGAAFSFLGEVIPRKEETDESRKMAELLRSRLGECMEKDAEGRPRLTVTLPDESALDQLARSLASLLVRT